MSLLQQHCLLILILNTSVLGTIRVSTCADVLTTDIKPHQDVQSSEPNHYVSKQEFPSKYNSVLFFPNQQLEVKPPITRIPTHRF